MHTLCPSVLSLKRPIVSVVIAGGLGLSKAEDAIDRILGQTLDQTEIIYVVPSDASYGQELEDEYDDRNVVVRIFDHAGNDRCDQWNVGLDAAEGDYVIFLDDECVLEGSALQVASKKGNKFDADIVLMNENHFTEDGDRNIGSFRQLQTDRYQNNCAFSGDDVDGTLFVVASRTIQSKLLKREFIEANSLHFIAGTYMASEQFACICLALAKRICGIQSCLVHLPDDTAYRRGDWKLVAYYNELYNRLSSRNVFASVRAGFFEAFLEDFVFEYVASTESGRQDLVRAAEGADFIRNLIDVKDASGKGNIDWYKMDFFCECLKRDAPTKDALHYGGAPTEPEPVSARGCKYVVVGDGLVGSMVNDLFGDAARANAKDVLFLEPYVFPDQATEDEYRVSLQRMDDGKTPPSAFRSRWRRYSPLLALESSPNVCVPIFFLANVNSPYLVDPELACEVKRQHGANVRTYLLLVDAPYELCKNMVPELSSRYLACFDRVLTTSEELAQRLGIRHFYAPYPCECPQVEQKKPVAHNDLFFYGSAEGCETLLLDMADMAHRRGATIDFTIAGMDARGERKTGVHRLRKRLAYDDVASMATCSGCLLDVAGDSKHPSWERYLEALTYNKRLLTNCDEVKGYPFYNKDYIRVFSRVEDADIAWALEPVPVDYGYDGRFELTSVLDRIINDGMSVPPSCSDPGKYEPLVSVVIPTYNRETTIMRSVKSVLGQTYGRLELIVVDDGSSDGTLELLKGIDDARMRVVSIPNSGACAARNYGIGMCEGDFIAFQDSDDEWLPNKIEMQVSALKDNPGADAVFCNALRSADEEDGIWRGYRPLITKRTSGFMQKEELQRKSLVGTPTLMARRSCFDDDVFDVEMGRLQDFDLVFRLAERHAIYYLAIPLLYVYVQDDSISRSAQKTIDARKRMIEKYPLAMDNSVKVYEGMLGSIYSNVRLLEQDDVELVRHVRYLRRLLKEMDKTDDLAYALAQTRARAKKLSSALAKAREESGSKARRIGELQDALVELQKELAEITADKDALSRELESVKSTKVYKVMSRLGKSR